MLSDNEKLPPLKFRYFEKYEISFETFNVIYDYDQPEINLVTLNSFTIALGLWCS